MLSLRRSAVTLMFAFFTLGASTSFAHELRELAHDVDSTAAHFHEWLEHELADYGWQGSQAIMAAHQLSNSASHFHRQVETYYTSPMHLVDDFYQLQGAFYRLQNALQYSGHTSYHDYQDFMTLSQSFQRLEAYFYGFGGGPGGGGHGGGHGDGGHGGWGWNH